MDVSNYQFHNAISVARYARYLTACNNNNSRASQLYRANICLSKELYAITGIFEVVFRNAINKHFTLIKGNEWLSDAVQEGGYLDVSVGCENSFHSVQEAIQSLGKNYTHDRLIAKLSLGFWRYQFAKKEFAASGSTLLKIFSNRPLGTKQKKVFQELTKINDLRNRIAHHEPICFENDYISINRTNRRYLLILEILNWLGCDTIQLLEGIDNVQNEINKMLELQNSTETLPNSLKR